MLIKYNACVNATDKWAFTPLHEAAQKGRTQLCALLLAHGADPTLKNQEGQTPLDLVSVSDEIFEKSQCFPDVLKIPLVYIYIKCHHGECGKIWRLAWFKFWISLVLKYNE